MRSNSREINSPKSNTTPLTVSDTVESAEMFYPASSQEKSSEREENFAENLDQMSKGHSSESVASDKYYTPEEDGPFFADFTVS